MKRKRPVEEDMPENKVKAVEYIIPFLPPCDACGRCGDEPRRRTTVSNWEWMSEAPALPAVVPSSSSSSSSLSASSTLSTAFTTGRPHLFGGGKNGYPLPVPIIDARSPDAYEQYQKAIALGEPIVLTGPKMKCLTDFSTPWFVNGVFNPEEFCNSVGDAVGPVARDGYTGSQLEKGETMKVADYMRKYWPLSNHKERCPYLAQWEFGSAVIDAEDETEDYLDERGLRALHWKLSTVPVDVVGTDFFSLSGINPYQYLFIGGPGTNSTVHNDLGGMTIFIVGMVGEKSVTMIHRDAEEYMYGLEARKNGAMSLEDMDIHPLAHLARSWHHVIVPGDVLVMPPRLIHAVENLTACVSYSRCHLGPNEMGEWLRSYLVFDSPQMNHERVISEATNHFLSRYDRGDLVIDKADDVECVRTLRDACRVLAANAGNRDGASEAEVGVWIALGNRLDKALPPHARKTVAKSNVEFDGDAVVVGVKGSDIKRITPGDVVSLLPGVALGKRCGRRAVVVGIHRLILVRVKYSDFPGTELVPVKRVRAVPNKKHGTPKLAKDVKVIVSWPVTGESFEAVLVNDVPSAPSEAIEMQFHRLGAEWNQWVTARDIAHVTTGFKIEL